MNKVFRTRKSAVIFYLAAIGVLVLSACGPSTTPAPTPDVAAIQTESAQAVIAELTASAPQPTEAPALMAMPTATPPPPGPTPDPNIPVAVVPTPAPGEPSAIANYNTTIFGGPGEDYVMYTMLQAGKVAKVTGISEDGQWWVINVPPAPNGQGWVSRAWVSVTGAEAVPVVQTPPVPPTVELIPPGSTDPQAMAIANVYIRTGPGTNYPAYGIAHTGKTARVIGKSVDGHWWVVRLNPEKILVGYGWVSGDYVRALNTDNVQTIATPTAPQTVTQPPPAAGVPVAMAVEYVNVRTGPGTNYTALGVAPPGASAEVSGKSSDGYWWQVKIPTQYASDGFGWVSADYVLAQNTGSVPVVAAPPAPPPVESTPPPLPPEASMTCTVASQDPADGTVYGPGSSFYTTWVLQNIGDTNWDQGQNDIRFIGAQGNVILHQGADIYDLTNTVEPGWTYTFSVMMIMPYDPGQYGEVWYVMRGNQPVCEFYIYLEVK